jgi:hypothetical protein
MLDTQTIRDEIYSLLTEKYERVMSGQKEASDDEMTLVLDDSAYSTAETVGLVREVTVNLRLAIVNVQTLG